MKIYGQEITTIISDLDGTLLGRGMELDSSILRLIAQLRRRGVRFIAASGRQYKNMRLLFEPIMDEILFVCENGSLVVRNDRTLFVSCIPRELCFELLADMLMIPEAETIVSSERELYTLASHVGFVRMMSGNLKPAISVTEDYRLITGGINKISIWWKDGIPARWESWFHEKYDGRLQAADAGNGWLDFTMEGVNKGEALRRLAELEGFSLREALCFGDSENDVSMFRVCGSSYAMSSGREHVRAAANHVCENVGETLRSFLEEAGE